MLFIAGTIFSHYTTALIFLGIISLAYLIDLIFSRYKNQKGKSFYQFAAYFLFLEFDLFLVCTNY